MSSGKKMWRMQLAGDLSYEEQLKKKQKQIRKLLKDICLVEPIIGMKNPYHYRNKVNAAFAHRRDGSIVFRSL